ncbi:MAG: septum formation initiator family protein [Verrucomicrobia bacterium]|nr:septum formation initiator family protein [Verrucomicrobiota bacterium]
MRVDVGIWAKLNRLVIFLLVFAIVLGVVIWYIPVIKNNEALRKEILILASQVQQEEEQAKRLEARIRALRNDPKAVERVVREKLGYVKPGETMIRFLDPAASAASGLF